MKHRTTRQAATAAKCSPVTIQRLLKAGKLQGVKSGKNWTVTGTKEEVVEAVNRAVTKHGWKRKTAKAPVQRKLPFNAVAEGPVVRAGKGSVTTSDLTFWISLTQGQRDTLRFLHQRIAK